MKKHKKKIIIVGIFAVIVAAVVTGIALKTKNSGKKEVSHVFENDMVIRGNIEETISGSAALEPYERYEIIAKVNGDIISSPYEVGDAVSKGDVLYRFDSSDANTQIEKQQISFEQSQNSYNKALDEADKLIIKAPCDGVVSGLSIKAGEDVKAGQSLATIENSYKLEVDLPFNDTQVQNIYVGSSATVSSSVHMSSVRGTVTHVAANPTAQPDGSVLYNVTVEMDNPGSFTAGMVVGGEIEGMISPGSGTVKFKDVQELIPDVAGTVKSVNIKNGDYVQKGAVLITLTSDLVSDSIKNSTLQYKSATISLQETRDGLDNYIEESPINGTVLTKNKKAGDTVDRTSDTQVLMVVGDVSRLKFSLSVDELDVSKVKVGQQVRITCEAVEGEFFKGTITNVSVEGTPTNGVTVYEAEVVIDEPGSLRPDMNIDATVVIASSSDTLMVPTADVETIMGKSYVFIKDSGEGNNEQEKKSDKSKEKNEEKSEAKNGKGMQNSGMRMPQAPEGYKAVEVTVGLSNDNFTEILSGVKEGDEIYRKMAATGNGMSMFGGMGAMGGMPGGMGASRAGGGMPGGMGANRAGGGMGGMRQ